MTKWEDWRMEGEETRAKAQRRVEEIDRKIKGLREERIKVTGRYLNWLDHHNRKEPPKTCEYPARTEKYTNSRRWM